MTTPVETYFKYFEEELHTFLPDNFGIEMTMHAKDGIQSYHCEVFDHHTDYTIGIDVALAPQLFEYAQDKDHMLKLYVRHYLKPLREKLAPKPDLATKLVTEFHETYNQPVRTTPSLNVPEKLLRLALVLEEAQELQDAILADDLVETYDALLDIIWVCHGALLTFGLPFREGIEEVARSNRSKLGEDGLPIYRESDGKVMKGPDFFPPNLKGIIDAAQETTERG